MLSTHRPVAVGALFRNGTVSPRTPDGTGPSRCPTEETNEFGDCGRSQCRPPAPCLCPSFEQYADVPHRGVFVLRSIQVQDAGVQDMADGVGQELDGA